MSNAQPHPASLSEYLAHLPLSDEQRAELANCTSFAELHARLSAQSDVDAAEAAQASVGTRLNLSSAAELEEAEMLALDASGRVMLKATPPIRRTKVVPEPWRTNILVRGWRRLTGRSNPPKPEIDERVLPKARWRTVGSIRRYILLVLMLGQTIVAGWYMKGIMPYQGWSFVDLEEVLHQPLMQTAQQVLPYALQTSILILFGILFCWVSAGFWTALMGFLELLTGHDKYRISGASAGNEPIPEQARTALVMPICNEDVTRVFAGLRATYESVAATGDLDRFDFFVLSDSNDPDICVAEQQAWLDVCRETEGFGRIFYRRRRRRVKRKSGNLDDFCRRWGGDYKYMVVLDADSVMSGECLTSLVRLMEATPDAGIIQTAPRASGMDTLYARMQQFATRVYGPLFTAGLHFWQLGESHYWGHNAIIRMKPFIEHCALAPLPGKGAFAGAILSHDFVEVVVIACGKDGQHTAAGRVDGALVSTAGDGAEDRPDVIELRLGFIDGEIGERRIAAALGVLIADADAPTVVDDACAAGDQPIPARFVYGAVVAEDDPVFRARVTVFGSEDLRIERHAMHRPAIAVTGRNAADMGAVVTQLAVGVLGRRAVVAERVAGLHWDIRVGVLANALGDNRHHLARAGELRVLGVHRLVEDPQLDALAGVAGRIGGVGVHGAQAPVGLELIAAPAGGVAQFAGFHIGCGLGGPQACQATQQRAVWHAAQRLERVARAGVDGGC